MNTPDSAPRNPVDQQHVKNTRASIAEAERHLKTINEELARQESDGPHPNSAAVATARLQETRSALEEKISIAKTKLANLEDIHGSDFNE